MDCLEFSIKSLEEKCKCWGSEISKDYQPDLIIFVARGSYLIGKALSKYFGVSLIAVGAERSGNNFKEFIAPFLSVLPRWFCNLLRKAELKSNVHKKKEKRNIKFLDTIDKYKNKNKNKSIAILIVDDSIDTGNSMKQVVEFVKSELPVSIIRVAALNVWDESENIIKADYYCYRNAIMRTPMSKDSKEYILFKKMFENRHGEKNEI